MAIYLLIKFEIVIQNFINNLRFVLLISLIFRLAILPFSVLFIIISNIFSNKPSFVFVWFCLTKRFSSAPSSLSSSRDTFSAYVPVKMNKYLSHHILTILVTFTKLPLDNILIYLLSSRKHRSSKMFLELLILDKE